VVVEGIDKVSAVQMNPNLSVDEVDDMHAFRSMSSKFFVAPSSSSSTPSLLSSSSSCAAIAKGATHLADVKGVSVEATSSKWFGDCSPSLKMEIMQQEVIASTNAKKEGIGLRRISQAAELCGQQVERMTAFCTRESIELPIQEKSFPLKSQFGLLQKIPRNMKVAQPRFGSN